MDFMQWGGGEEIPWFQFFLCPCGHLEFLWDLSVDFSTELFVHAYHLYSFSGEGRNSDPLPGCILNLPCVFWVCNQPRIWSLLIIFCLRV